MRPLCLLVCLLALASGFLVGCASVHTSAPIATALKARGSGRVFGGQQPVSGAAIQLYAVGTAGDGSTATALLTQPVFTGQDGSFDITEKYPCGASTYIYLVATGGNPGLSTVNPNIAMMTSLGLCSHLNSNTFISVNEATTVAAISALAPFMRDYRDIGYGAKDSDALIAAFALSSQLVDTASGLSPGQNVPSGYSVPTAEIDTLADILAGCVNSTGGAAGDGTLCGQLFTLATPATGIAPTDTSLAMLNVVNNPKLNTAQLYNLIPAISPFNPQMSSAPADLSVRESASGSLQVSPLSVALKSTAVGTVSDAKSIVLTNTGSSAITLPTLGLIGPNAAEFTLASGCGSTLQPNSSCSATITCTPTATGSRTAYLALTQSGTAFQPLPLVLNMTPLDAGSVPAIGAGSSRYYIGSESSSIDTVQGYMTYLVPAGASGMQIVFGNAQSTQETCGPSMVIRASIENPVGSTPLPLYFDGARDGSLAPCGILTSAPLSANHSSSAQPVHIRWRATRATGDSTPFPVGWSFGYLGADDGVEELQTRTVNDGAISAGSMAFSSGTANFVPQDAGQTISIAGAGASGGTLSTTIGTVLSSSSITLSDAAGASVSGATSAIVPADKTLSGTIYNRTQVFAYTPYVLLAQQTGKVKSVGLVGDSISYGQGSNFPTGSWAVQSLNAAGIAVGTSTVVYTAIPYVQASMPQESLANLVNHHTLRFSQLKSTKYILGMLGTNDALSGQSLASMKANFITLTTTMRALGPLPFYGTVVPSSTSTDNFITLAGQTTQASDPVRRAFNAWLRDGAPIDNQALTPVAPGTSSSTSSRAAYYDQYGTLVTAATGEVQHPVEGIFELADSVESSRDSGIWKVDPNSRNVTGCSIAAQTTTLTCSGGGFTAADANSFLSIPGAAGSGAALAEYVTVYVDSNTVQLSYPASATVSNITVNVDGGGAANTTGHYTVDGVHPSPHGHYAMGVAGSNLVAGWTF